MSERIGYRRHIIRIIQDDTPLNPRVDCDNLGVMVCFHNRYRLGDEGHGFRSEDYNGWDDLEKGIEREHGPSIILPIYMYDHSGCTINTTGFSCHWDSGQIGFIFIQRERARKEYGWKVITKKREQQIRDMLKGEVETYDQFLRGDVYGYQVISPDGEELDSCWGFFKYDHEESGLLDEARSNIDWHIKQAREEWLEQLKTWVRNRVPLQYRHPAPMEVFA
jgi:hypothetical protein